MSVCSLLHKFFTFLKVLFKGQLIVTISKKCLKHKWEIAKADRKDYIISSYNGYRILLYSDSKLRELIATSAYEKAEQLFLQAFLKPGDVFLDVGANIGIFSLLASKKVGKKGFIHSFEPTPQTFQRLTYNIKLNSFQNIYSHNKALSNKVGDNEFIISLDGFDAWNSFGKPSQGTNFTKLIVETDTLDNFIKGNCLTKIDLIKIDVEGWEVPVLEGGVEYFTKPNSAALLVEFSDQNLLNAGYTSLTLFNKLIDYGYKIFYYDVKNQRLVPERFRQSYQYLNLIALKQLYYTRIKIPH